MMSEKMLNYWSLVNYKLHLIDLLDSEFTDKDGLTITIEAIEEQLQEMFEELKAEQQN